MRTLTLDLWLDAPGVDYSDFGSMDSIFEYDIVFWDPANTLETYNFEPGKTHYKGAPRLDSHDSVRILKDIQRRRKEFSEFLAMGRTLVIFGAPPQEFYYDTGKREKSGTGRNQQVTVLLDSSSLLEALPVEIEMSAARGQGISPKHSGFRSIWRAHKDRWRYRVVFDKYAGDSIAVVEGTNKCIASILRYDAGGILLFLPDLEELDSPEVVDGDVKVDPASETSESQSTSAAEVIEELIDPAAVDLISWVKSLGVLHGQSIPPWLERCEFPEDVENAEHVKRIKEDILALKQRLEELEVESDNSRQWKQLIYAQGVPLERQAMQAFEAIGFESQQGPEGRADILLRKNGVRAVVEVKGVSKSAAEKNAAQLEKWVSEEIVDGESKVKGILLVNAWREIAPDVRSEPAFPSQMVDFSVRREHCLMTGGQLLAMVRACMANPSRADSIASEILQTVGVLEGWDDPGFLLSGAKTV
ncbi:hypothetical protein [Streptomyces sp. NPDC059743]|uniref:hypothetical protein n=1 Tax=Streptomyces sp. NPDC059743 TaxID=3346928 RepID=UPI0036557043